MRNSSAADFFNKKIWAPEIPPFGHPFLLLLAWISSGCSSQQSQLPLYC